MKWVNKWKRRVCNRKLKTNGFFCFRRSPRSFSEKMYTIEKPWIPECTIHFYVLRSPKKKTKCIFHFHFIVLKHFFYFFIYIWFESDIVLCMNFKINSIFKNAIKKLRKKAWDLQLSEISFLYYLYKNS